MNLTILLRTCRLFADLEAPELAALLSITQRMEYRKGQEIFTESEVSRGFCVLIAGTVKIFRTGPDGRERIIHVVAAGDAFAEAAMFMEAYPATAEALSTATVLWIEKYGFRQLLARDAKLSFKIMGALVRWLNHLRNALTDLTLKDVPARFASYVLSLPAKPGKAIGINISKTTLAQMLGTTKETLSRLLTRLTKQRVLTYRGNEIRILDRDRLEKIASSGERV
ncbi:MAG: Crp/Fnr family transcriptional regulator [Verrucomicrobiota bacterium]|jgi:CRP/FNR family transcriptional regulator, dissimilatory nitrate respiration regulator